MNLPGEVPNFDINIKAGADYRLTLQFEADDDEEITNYGTTIYNGSIFLTDNSVIDDEDEHAWYPDPDEWLLDESKHALLIDSKWNIEAQLRDFEESADSFTFGVEASIDGFVLVLPKEVTEQIHFARGVYDIFITDIEGLRGKLLQGKAIITRNVTR